MEEYISRETFDKYNDFVRKNQCIINEFYRILINMATEKGYETIGEYDLTTTFVNRIANMIGSSGDTNTRVLAKLLINSILTEHEKDREESNLKENLPSLKLYKVVLRGFYGHGSGRYKYPHVVARDPGEAYEKVRNYLEKEDLGLREDKELDYVQLIADNYRYTDVPSFLFL